jgi:hypothetical protein
VVAVSDYQTLMAPVLHALGNGAEQPISQLRSTIAKQIGLTDEDLKATLPSGSRLFVNRPHWTITYLNQAGLIGRPAGRSSRSPAEPRPCVHHGWLMGRDDTPRVARHETRDSLSVLANPSMA